MQVEESRMKLDLSRDDALRCSVRTVVINQIAARLRCFWSP